jgi:uncharacterized protein
LEKCRRIDGLTDYIAARYGHIAEIGIGHFPDMAFSLMERGVKVMATDIYPFQYDGLNVVTDDITAPELSIYENVKLLYSMRPPSELVPYMKRLAGMISADLIVKPLSSEYMDGELMRYENVPFYFWAKGIYHEKSGTKRETHTGK